MIEKLLTFLNNEKKFKFIFFILIVFLCVVKLPSVFSDDIQPWDEGMYATRVLSIHDNGDFLNQSSHSVQGFYSASHPPLLIWTGYFVSQITGMNSVSLKLIPFILSLFCIYLLTRLGEKICNPLAGIIAAIFFSSSIIYSVFSKRFQFDIPYTFLILLSFYIFFLFIEKRKLSYIILGGVVFGLCLMVKILVGFFIPMILFFLYLLMRKKINLHISEIIIFTFVGILIALPWHLYMILNYGNEFFNYFLNYHIIERAFTGVEHNTKNSGFLYHVNYLLSIIPYSILAFWGVVKYLIDYKSLTWQKVFLLIWFLTGFFIITLFKTKLEVYVLLILVPGSLIIGEYLSGINKTSYKEKLFVLILTFLNILWYISFFIRNDMKLRQEGLEKLNILIPVVIVSLLLVYFVSVFLAKKNDIGKFYYIFIILFFISLNTYYLFNTPVWENGYKLTPVKQSIGESNRKKIVYVGTNYRANPQFSFYFKGLNLGWKNVDYDFELLDTKIGNKDILDRLEKLKTGEFNIIVEKDNINRTDYEDSKNFIPPAFKLIKKTWGYELYQN
jgi:4-amino-4-deoxy-L-arabinose transferase-like glycosyltransferase